MLKELVKTYNAINGVEVSRDKIQKIADLAKKLETIPTALEIHKKLHKLLMENPNAKLFELELDPLYRIPEVVPKKTENKKEKSTTLNAPNLSDKKSALEKLGFVNAAKGPKKPANVFRLPGAIGKFIQDVQRFQELILIKGNKHSSKSQLAMQTANGFGELDMLVAYIDEEQGGLSCKDTIASRDRNTTAKGIKNIYIIGHLDNAYEQLETICKECDVIVADSVTDLKLSADEINDLRKKYPETIWIFISQVKENGEMYGGNKMAHNATKIISCSSAHAFNDRIASLEKNRGNSLDPQYIIAKKQLKKVTKAKEGK